MNISIKAIYENKEHYRNSYTISISQTYWSKTHSLSLTDEFLPFHIDYDIIWKITCFYNVMLRCLQLEVFFYNYSINLYNVFIPLLFSVTNYIKLFLRIFSYIISFLVNIVQNNLEIKSLKHSIYTYYKSPDLNVMVHLRSSAYSVIYKLSFFNNSLKIQFVNGYLPCSKVIFAFYIFQTLIIIFQLILGAYLKLLLRCKNFIYDKTIILNLYFAVYYRIMYFIENYFLISKYKAKLSQSSNFPKIVFNTVYLDFLISNEYCIKIGLCLKKKLLLYLKWI